MSREGSSEAQYHIIICIWRSDKLHALTWNQTHYSSEPIASYFRVVGGIISAGGQQNDGKHMSSQAGI